MIGNGNRHFAGAFREDLQLDTPLYVDTTRASYSALGMKRGIARTLGFLEQQRGVPPEDEAIVRRTRGAVGREMLKPPEMGVHQLVPSRNTKPRQARNFKM